MTATEARRRKWVTEPGETLLPANNAAQTMQRAVDFAAQTTLAPEQVFSSVVSAVPLPYYTGDQSLRERFAEVPVEMMWHPLFWLPPSLAQRAEITTDRGSTHEPADLWAVRVVLNLILARFYTTADGTWIDVLSLIGIDVEDPVDAARVQAWQSGESDDELDTLPVVLEGIFVDPEGPKWGTDLALMCMPVMRAAGWAACAWQLMADIQGVVEDRDATASDQVSVLRITTLVASKMFAYAAQSERPSVHDSNVGMVVHDNTTWWNKLLNRMEEALDNTPDKSAVAETLVSPFMDRLATITVRYAPAADQLQELMEGFDQNRDMETAGDGNGSAL